MILFTYGDKYMAPVGLPWFVKLAPLAAITVISSLLLVFRLGDKAPMYMSLRVQFEKLAAYLKSLEVEREVSEKTVAERVKRRAEIEIDEPKVLRVLETRCLNETNQAMGYRHNFVPLTKWQKRF